MIININFRHNTHLDGLKSLIIHQISKLNRFASTITQVRVVFSKTSHRKKSEQLIQCHILLHAAVKININIYEYKSTPISAFNSAYERIVNTLSRIKQDIGLPHKI